MREGGQRRPPAPVAGTGLGLPSCTWGASSQCMCGHTESGVGAAEGRQEAVTTELRGTEAGGPRPEPAPAPPQARWAHGKQPELSVTPYEARGTQATLGTLNTPWAWGRGSP